MDKERLASKKYKLTKEIMKSCLKLAKPLSWYKTGKKIKVLNRMQSDYEYKLTYDAGTNLHLGGIENGIQLKYPDFKPKFSPGEMLLMGVFEGKYCNDQILEFPREWFNLDKLSPERANPAINYFGVKSRLSLQEWLTKKWIPVTINDNDSRGWFEWYCRYWLGRRQPDVDEIQIKRWKAFKRHYGQYLKNTKGHKGIHLKRRQALLQWSYPCDG